ncbi:MAG: hypothetical protein RL375_1708 [Pseudomonadota bacterium]
MVHDETPAGDAPFYPHTPLAGAPRRLAVQFTGSGSEYFRIWIVNLLLSVVTLGLYYPYAVARRRAYFYGNSRVGGDPLAFHGRGATMLKGYLIAAVLLAAYFLSQEASLTLAGLVLVLIVGLAPALFRSGQRFRMANTSWRGLRMGFAGDTAGAYRELAAVMVVGAVVLGGNVIALAVVTLAGEAGAALFGLASLVAVLCVPYCQWRLKSFQHRHYRYGSATTDFELSASAFYGANFRAGALMVATMLVLGIMAAVLVPALGPGPMIYIFGAVGLAGYVAAWAYYMAQIQNLVWNATRGPQVRFESTLSGGATARLAARNFLLTVLTLGLYRPFAAVAMARLRLEAVAVVVAADFEDRIRAVAGTATDATGDAAGDLFGLDVGL